MSATLVARIVPPALFPGGRAMRLVERNFMVYRRGWLMFVSGFFEPLFYLLSVGVGGWRTASRITHSQARRHPHGHHA